MSYIYLILECDRRGNEHINIGRVVAAYSDLSVANKELKQWRGSNTHYHYGIDTIFVTMSLQLDKH